MIFNSNDFGTAPQKTKTFADLPEGTYSVIIESEETKPTKSGNGEYLQLVFKVDEGPRAGAKIFDRLNLRNPSAKAVEIAQEALARICEVCGLSNPNDSSELVGKRLKVTTQNESYQGKVYPRVKGYQAHPEAEAQAAAEFLDDLPF